MTYFLQHFLLLGGGPGGKDANLSGSLKKPCGMVLKYLKRLDQRQFESLRQFESVLAFLPSSASREHCVGCSVGDGTSLSLPRIKILGSSTC